MSAPGPQQNPRGETATQILDCMQMLVQTRGYNAISYQDIAAELGIRKASIHYHFATKAELGVAVVQRYQSQFTALLTEAEQSGANAWQQLAVFFAPFQQFGNTADKICLCGALAGEFLALPAPMQQVVSDFFAVQQRWLEALLRRGRRAGDFAYSGSAARQARLAFSALQGALLIKRTSEDTRQIADVVSAIRAGLKPGQ